MEFCFLIVLLSATCLSTAQGYTWAEWTPLDDYVMSDWPDDIYNWTFHAVHRRPGYQIHVLQMTSLKWENSHTDEASKIWKHWIVMIIPDDIKVFHAAYVRIETGLTDEDPVTWKNLDNIVEHLARFSLQTGAISAEVRNIPAQPAVFLDDGQPQIEDNFLARTIIPFLDGSSPNTSDIVMLPMARASRRGLDTVADYAKTVNPSLQIHKFVVGGRSKRGWMSYFMGALDRRVIAISPEASGNLNYFENEMTHFRSLGGWTWAGIPYWSRGIMSYQREPSYARYNNEIPMDSFQFLDRLRGILIMTTLASGEEFFLVDLSWHYLEHFVGKMYYRIVPNTDHRFLGYYNDIYKNINSFFLFSLNKKTMPQLRWKRKTVGGKGKLIAITDRRPIEVRGYMAQTTNETINEDGTHRRDFRWLVRDQSAPSLKLKRNPIVWKRVPVRRRGSKYKMAFREPQVGYRAFFMEFVFPGYDPANPHLDTITVTTEVQVVPDTLPYPPCDSLDTCTATLK